jgi:hypothetical protein
MRSDRRRFTRARALPFIAMASGMSLSSMSNAQELHPDIPTSSHYNASGQGWTCNDGFKQVAGFCVREMPDPPNQDAKEFFDGQWRCVSGYHRTNGFCALLTAPAHATLVGVGARWECDWGFRKVASRCEEINPPAHAYLEASGQDWACFPQFERVADRCVRTQAAPESIPEAKPGATEESKPTSDPPSTGRS